MNTTKKLYTIHETREDENGKLIITKTFKPIGIDKDGEVIYETILPVNDVPETKQNNGN